MADPFIGQVVLFAGNFAPRGWAFCDGQLLPINTNTALFSILGTTYGGDGRTNFGLPDLRGRVPVGPRSGPGLTQRNLGARFGQNSHTLTTQQMPSHTHTLQGNAEYPSTDSPAGGSLATQEFRGYADSSTTPTTPMHGASVSSTGNNQSFRLDNPGLGLNYIIALVGTFPSRS